VEDKRRLTASKTARLDRLDPPESCQKRRLERTGTIGASGLGFHSQRKRQISILKRQSCELTDGEMHQGRSGRSRSGSGRKRGTRIRISHTPRGDDDVEGVTAGVRRKTKGKKNKACDTLGKRSRGKRGGGRGKQDRKIQCSAKSANTVWRYGTY